MNLQARLTTGMEQRLAMLPKMLQSIEILQLTSVDLLALIDRELEQNETLVAEPIERPEAEFAEAAPSSQRDEGFEPSTFEPQASGSSDEDAKLSFLNNVPDQQESLVDHLRRQLGWLEIPPDLVEGVSSLAERLDSRGLLSATDAELLDVLDAEALLPCIEILQSLEPRGVGGRDPIGAMLLQLPKTDPDLADITSMLTKHLEELAKNKLPDVARALGRSLEEVHGLLERIKRLDPRPGEQFTSEPGRETIYPDVTVRLVAGRIEIEIDEMVLPDLGIRQDYRDMADSGDIERKVKSYLRDKLRSARDLIVAVEQRKRTLGRVTLAIMQRQLDFLERGRLSVHPLCMSRIADELDLHPSTVSRAIAGKYVQTDHGIFRLRDFFDGERGNGPTDGDRAGRMAIKDHIRDLVGNEDPAAPLSDGEIVRLLLQRNITVARRTVAKYRNELGLQSSWRRRRFEESG